MQHLTLLRLLQLASPTLPVGAYTYSQGLEWVVESGQVRDEASTRHWIASVLACAVSRFEGPLLAAQMQAWQNLQMKEIRRLNDAFLASRETAELRAETVQMGYSLRRLAGELPGTGPLDRDALASLPEAAFPTVWAALAAAYALPPAEAVAAYLFSWCENQIMAAVKAVPLGQTAGQRLLGQMVQVIPALAERALQLPETRWSNFAPGLALASCHHETQYSRIFRS